MDLVGSSGGGFCGVSLKGWCVVCLVRFWLSNTDLRWSSLMTISLVFVYIDRIYILFSLFFLKPKKKKKKSLAGFVGQG